MIPFRSFHLKKKKIKDAVFRSTITDDLNNSLVTPLITTSLISSTIHVPQANNYIDSKSNLVRKAKGDQRVVCGGTNTKKRMPAGISLQEAHPLLFLQNTMAWFKSLDIKSLHLKRGFNS